MAKNKGKSKRQRQTTEPKQVVKAPAASGKSPVGMYLGAFAVAVLIGFFLNQTSDNTPNQPTPPDAPIAGLPDIVTQSADEIHAHYAGSKSCRECHEEQFKEWTGSHHQIAERAVTDHMDQEAFHPHRTIKHATQTSEAQKKGEEYQIVTLGKGDEIKPYKLKRAIGVAPLLQYLTEEEGGRLQAIDLAWDPHKKEWFNVYGEEDRRPGEWGHWTGRGMNWNAMCASCHNTRVLKNYDPQSDTYDTKMAEIGVGCESCHGGMKDHVDWQLEYKDQSEATLATDPTLKDKRFTRDQHIQNCAPCHARRTELTGDYIPGENFYDHYSLTIPDHTDIFYPDGQVRDEDYEYTSFASSRMHAAGVRCMDCHNPHTAKLRVPGNLMCMTCHSGENPDLPNLPKIDPATHSFHKSETEPGGRCVDCHMPLTTYMQRHPRRDHGFTIPDPLLTKQHGIPNACNRCHDDKSTDWALEHVDKWYGDKMNRPYRQRAQWVAMAKTNAPGAHINLITMAKTETNHLWRAVSASMMQNFLYEPDVREALLQRLTDKHPLVRGNAILSLEPLVQQTGSREREAIRNLLDDPVRKVRVDAAWALRSILDTNSLAGRELRQYFRQTGDQPAGMMQQGVFHYDRQQHATAAGFFRKAGSWDTNTAAPHHELAVALSVQGRAQEAVNELRIACAKDPNHAGFRYRLGLGLGELGDLPGAKAAFEESVRLDPTLADAWYNHGLALNSMDQPDEAIGALLTAEKHDRISARAPYARATILARLRRMPEAREAAQLALRREPNHGPSRQLWAQLGGTN